MYGCWWIRYLVSPPGLLAAMTLRAFSGTQALARLRAGFDGLRAVPFTCRGGLFSRGLGSDSDSDLDWGLGALLATDARGDVREVLDSDGPPGYGARTCKSRQSPVRRVEHIEYSCAEGRGLVIVSRGGSSMSVSTPVLVFSELWQESTQRTSGYAQVIAAALSDQQIWCIPQHCVGRVHSQTTYARAGRAQGVPRASLFYGAGYAARTALSNICDEREASDVRQIYHPPVSSCLILQLLLTADCVHVPRMLGLEVGPLMG